MKVLVIVFIFFYRIKLKTCLKHVKSSDAVCINTHARNSQKVVRARWQFSHWILYKTSNNLDIHFCCLWERRTEQRLNDDVDITPHFDFIQQQMNATAFVKEFYNVENKLKVISVWDRYNDTFVIFSEIYKQKETSCIPLKQHQNVLRWWWSCNIFGVYKQYMAVKW